MTPQGLMLLLLQATCHQPSASEVTTIWRYTNVYIIIIIINHWTMASSAKWSCGRPSSTWSVVTTRVSCVINHWTVASSVKWSCGRPSSTWSVVTTRVSCVINHWTMASSVKWSCGRPSSTWSVVSCWRYETLFDIWHLTLVARQHFCGSMHSDLGTNYAVFWIITKNILILIRHATDCEAQDTDMATIVMMPL